MVLPFLLSLLSVSDIGSLGGFLGSVLLISGVMVRTVSSVSAQAKKAAKIMASIKNVIEGNYITTLFRHVWGGNRMGDFCQEISK